MTSIFRTTRVWLRIGTWTYLAAYVVGGDSFGRAVMTRSHPLDSQEDVKEIEAWLEEMNETHAVVIGVTLLKRRRFQRWPADLTARRRATTGQH